MVWMHDFAKNNGICGNVFEKSQKEFEEQFVPFLCDELKNDLERFISHYSNAVSNGIVVSFNSAMRSGFNLNLNVNSCVMQDIARVLNQWIISFMKEEPINEAGKAAASQYLILQRRRKEELVPNLKFSSVVFCNVGEYILWYLPLLHCKVIIRLNDFEFGEEFLKFCWKTNRIQFVLVANEWKHMELFNLINVKRIILDWNSVDADILEKFSRLILDQTRIEYVFVSLSRRVDCLNLLISFSKMKKNVHILEDKFCDFMCIKSSFNCLYVDESLYPQDREDEFVHYFEKFLKLHLSQQYGYHLEQSKPLQKDSKLALAIANVAHGKNPLGNSFLYDCGKNPSENSFVYDQVDLNEVLYENKEFFQDPKTLAYEKASRALDQFELFVQNGKEISKFNRTLASLHLIMKEKTRLANYFMLPEHFEADLSIDWPDCQLSTDVLIIELNKWISDLENRLKKLLQKINADKIALKISSKLDLSLFTNFKDFNVGFLEISCDFNELIEIFKESVERISISLFTDNLSVSSCQRLQFMEIKSITALQLKNLLCNCPRPMTIRLSKKLMAEFKADFIDRIYGETCEIIFHDSFADLFLFDADRRFKRTKAVMPSQ